eukprot:CAMPEP_0113877858 /NCGR_PEP_ID=MMETSP0780_2-20120614/6342_1 /TAXON_ID=652834 /ORGANISM="Palpitomonas bilix" /LENGTH=282 /DNA_ID=CAMNT_0000864227 /DNA_START=38 /DNA_END=886 /DNA_ORIENTATION=+ /assembly_acc=CAM_ASM_000599
MRSSFRSCISAYLRSASSPSTLSLLGRGAPLRCLGSTSPLFAGHSKWKNIRHKKEAQDAKRSKTFSRISQDIRCALNEGGDDPVKNNRLAVALEKAKQGNFPKANLDRVFDKYRNAKNSGALERIIYEAKGPGSSALLIDVFTDSRNRTAPLLRHILSKHEGSLQASGAVSWMFTDRGVVEVDEVKDELSLMDALIACSFEDMEYEYDEEEKMATVHCDPSNVDDVRKGLEGEGLNVVSSGVETVTEQPADLTEEQEEVFQSLVSTLEDHEDVNSVTHNVDM